MKENCATKTILKSGFIAGSLDAIAGVIVYYILFGFSPFDVLRFIASGVHGMDAINGGVGMVLAGVAYHFAIAYIFAVFYFIVYPKVQLLQKYKVAMGLAFGLGIWLVMNLIILPNSNIPKAPFNAILAIAGIVWHMTLVGLPIALITSKHYEKTGGND